jgi:hypothetical protein
VGRLGRDGVEGADGSPLVHTVTRLASAVQLCELPVLLAGVGLAFGLPPSLFEVDGFPVEGFDDFADEGRLGVLGRDGAV